MLDVTCDHDVLFSCDWILDRPHAPKTREDRGHEVADEEKDGPSSTTVDDRRDEDDAGQVGKAADEVEEEGVRDMFTLVEYDAVLRDEGHVRLLAGRT